MMNATTARPRPRFENVVGFVRSRGLADAPRVRRAVNLSRAGVASFRMFKMGPAQLVEVESR